MKKLLLIIIAFCVSIQLVSAAASLSFNKNTVDFGDVDWDDDSSGTFTITNSGDADAHHISLSSTADSDYDIEFNANNFDLSAGQAKTVTVSMTLNNNPDFEGGNQTIGKIEITSDETSKQTVDLRLTAQDRLFIDKVDFKVGSKSDFDVKDGDKIDAEAKGTEKVQVTISFENMFDADDDEYDIEDIKAKLTIFSIDDGDDLSEEVTRFVIGPGNKASKNISIELPTVVADDTYDVELKIDGKNAETNKRYNFTYEYRLESRKEKDDVRIESFEITPNTVECGAQSFTAHVVMRNYGKDEQDDVLLEFRNSDLNLRHQQAGIDMGTDKDKDAKFDETIIVPLADPLRAGTYHITANVYYDTENLDDQRIVPFTVTCGTAPINATQANQTNSTPTNATPHNQTVPGIAPPAVTIGNQEEQNTSSRIMMIGTIGLLVLIIAIIIVAAIVAGKRD